jgi:hypothetical protein
MPGDPDYITVSYHGGLIKTMDQKVLKSFLTARFNEVAEIFEKNGASVSADAVLTETYSAPGTVPTQNFDALAADLAAHKFTIQRKLMM